MARGHLGGHTLEGRITKGRACLNLQVFYFGEDVRIGELEEEEEEKRKPSAALTWLVQRSGGAWAPRCSAHGDPVAWCPTC